MDKRTTEDEVDEFEMGPLKFWFMDEPDKNAIPMDLGGSQSPDSMAIIAHEEQMAELIVGYGARNSGASDPTDPRAPASKTAMLMLEGNERMLEGADNMRPGINRALSQALKIHYKIQPRDERGNFTQDYEDGKDENDKPIFKTINSQDVDLDKIDIGINFELATQTLNRNIEKNEFQQVLEMIFKTQPELLRDPFVQGALLEHELELIESPLRGKLKLSQEEIEERQARIMARALEIKEEVEANREAKMENDINQGIRDGITEGQSQGMSDDDIIENEANKLVAMRDRMSTGGTQGA